MSLKWHWVTTAPSTLRPAWQEPTGWRLHAVQAPDKAKFAEIRRLSAACGHLPPHGWSMDLFIKKRCAKCLVKTGLACLKCKGKGQVRRPNSLVRAYDYCFDCLGTGEKPGAFDRDQEPL